MIEKKGFVRRSFGAMFNVSRWIAWNNIAISTKILWRIIRDLFVSPPKGAIYSETFEEAVQRLKLTEEDIKLRKRTLWRNAMAFLFISMLLFSYTIYLLINGYLLATCMGLLLTTLILAYAYREHFWYTQVKHRQLGLNFKAWRQLLFKKG